MHAFNCSREAFIESGEIFFTSEVSLRRMFEPKVSSGTHRESKPRPLNDPRAATPPTVPPRSL